MPDRCVAIGCNSGKIQETEEPNVSFHRFPKDEKIRHIWIRRIAIKNFELKDLLCSLHFVTSDFVTQSSDSNFTRKRKRSNELEDLYDQMLSL